MNPVRLAAFAFCLSWVALPAARLAAESAPPPPADETCARAEAVLARADLAAYRGWIKYLRFRAAFAAAQAGEASPAARDARQRLEEWATRILAEPDTLARLRGVQEWAYESPVDGSGQPFKLMIPTDYDPARPAPLSLYMHGYTGDHLKHSTGMAARAGGFEVSVLGRARAPWYLGLAQADVLHVLDYVQAHWNIDANRVRLTGGSMGGGGTVKLGARFPHRFAAGQITCGYLVQEPLDNLLTFPMYAVHSDDDPVVPINQLRGALRELARRGGQVVFDETTGYGHASWNYADGNRHADEFGARQVRPDSRTVRHLDFTATDGAAVRAWWAEVAEWGPQPRPARFIATAGADNTLYLELTNIARLRVRLTEAPFDRARPLHVVAGGRVPVTVPAPLPDSLVLGADGAPAAAEPAPAFRLHTPGGPLNLYRGEPLLIVYGTRGDAGATAALRAAADAAARSPNPGWLAADEGEIDPADADRTRHPHLLFGHLPVKADDAVTDDDLARCHLVLLGTAAENAVVAKLADRLPVRFADGRVTCTDGRAWAAARHTLGLVHFNPLAPERLVFWVAASDPRGYAPDAAVARLGAQLYLGADLILTSATGGTLVATRSFDSRWHWSPDREPATLIPASLQTRAALARGIAESVRRATGADFGLGAAPAALGVQAIVAGTTRVDDLAPLFHAAAVDEITVTGAELRTINERLARAESPLALVPAVDPARLSAEARYRLALPVPLLADFGRATLVNPPAQRRTDVMVDDALLRYLARP